MNIHEYQAKALLVKYGVAVPKGVAARSLAEFEPALAQFPEGPVVVKAQLHAGGRGKGTFTDGFKGGVKIAQSKVEALDFAKRMFGNTLVTAQTGPAGRKVQTIYFTQVSSIKKEYYLAILLDRATARPVIVASTEGGVEIEKVARETPEKRDVRRQATLKQAGRDLLISLRQEIVSMLDRLIKLDLRQVLTTEEDIGSPITLISTGPEITQIIDIRKELL